MTRRLLSLLAVSVVLDAAPVVLAQADAAPNLENAKHQFLGSVNANSVMVRSGPSSNDYPTLRLEKGAQVTVAGMKFDWLKIAPPDGSFSYVSKLYVERFGDGSVGKVTKDNLNVWCGSSLTTVKSALQCRLAKGTDVKILGEADVYYKIASPAEAFVWVHQNLVTPIKSLTPANPPPVASNNPPSDGGGLAGRPPTTGPTTEPTHVAAAPTTAPAPTVDPAAVAAAETEFDKVEASYRDNDSKAIEDQAIADLLASYDKLIGNTALPSSMRQIGESRVASLKVRAEAQVKLLELRKQREDAQAKLKPLKAEGGELAQKIQDIEASSFVAVGTLAASSLQLSGPPLLRLTDPANGRTVVYVRSSDAKLPGFIGKFAGVKGEVVSDDRLRIKIINVTDIAAVDPAKVGNGVNATMVPPSLLIKPAQARTDMVP